MPGPRLSKSIARWVAVQPPRRANPLRRAIRSGYLLAILVAVAWLAWTAAVGNRTIYRAGPLAGVHQSFENQCHLCHQQNWQGLSRLAALDNSHTSTPNAACQSCHPSSAHVDHVLAAAHQCADCHREHRGAERLVRVDEQFCVECHGRQGTDQTPPRNFAREVPGFASHPQFAVFRSEDDEPPGAEHLVHTVAEIAQVEGNNHWADKAQLRFNHRAHMHPDGVLLPRNAADGETEQQREKLECKSCHQPDAERRYMRPIRYEEHCRRCHALEWTVEHGENESKQMTTLKLPHREPELVRGAIRQQLAQLVSAISDVRGQNGGATSNAVIEELLSTPGLPQPRPVLEGELAWVNQQLQRAEHAVFGHEAKGGCRFCHTVTHENAQWQIVPPAVPDRWLLHSRFDHQRHRTVSSCEHCHTVSASTSTVDILLPKIEVCQACHRPADGRGGGGARTDCVECHDYHGRQNEHTAKHASDSASRE
jgi:hypothetical protein